MSEWGKERGKVGGFERIEERLSGACLKIVCVVVVVNELGKFVLLEGERDG